MSEPILSIIIPTLQNRIDVFLLLEKELWRQAAEVCTNFSTRNTEHGNNNVLHYSFISDQVECIVHRDNGEKTTGKKRQEGLEMASGKYVIGVDCDDDVMPYYLKELIAAAESDADCFAINGWITTDGANSIDWRLSKDNIDETIFENGKPIYLRHTNHITAVRRSIALQSGFPDISNGEDKAYSQGLKGLLHSEVKIDLPMYHYKFKSGAKEYLK